MIALPGTIGMVTRKGCLGTMRAFRPGGAGQGLLVRSVDQKKRGGPSGPPLKSSDFQEIRRS
jgi:hypothetical protein